MAKVANMVPVLSNSNFKLYCLLDGVDLKLWWYHNVGMGKGFQGVMVMIIFDCSKFSAIHMSKTAWAPRIDKNSDISKVVLES